MKKDLFIEKKRSPNILGFPNQEDKVPKEVPEDVPKVTMQKGEGSDSCLEDIVVKGLGFGSCSNKKLQ